MTDEDPSTPSQTSRGRVRRVVGLYVIAAMAWIGITSLFADRIARWLGVPTSIVEVAKGTLFVLVTAGVLSVSLDRWVRRIADAARAEHRAADRIREADRLRTRFLRGISHELRTPLTNILGFSLTLQAHGRKLDPATTEDFADRLARNARRLERLVLDLLDTARSTERSGVDPEPVDVDRLIREVLDRLPPAKQTIRLELGPVRAEIDRSLTVRAIEELLTNAIRHTPPATNIWIRGRTNGSSLRLVIEDDGPGIDADLVETVFEPFSQGSQADAAASPGVGIGLAVVRRCVALQGGSVSVEGAPGTGTRFVVTLPKTAVRL